MPGSKNSDSGEDQGRVAAFCTDLGEKWAAFRKFLWDPQEKTVLGRGGKSWGRILIFYAFYYSFLAALFAASLSIVLSCLDPYVPRFQTRLQTPGVSIQPRQSSYQGLTSDIKFSVSDPKSYKKFTDQMDELLYDYSGFNQSDPMKWRNCTNLKVLKSQGFTKDEINKACVFNKDVLGPCGTGKYGYDIGKPCLLVKVNKIINWFPVGFNDISKAVGMSDSKAPPLADVLNARGQQFQPYLIYVACYGRKEPDMLNLNGVAEQASGATKYYPASGGIPFKYYPYYGNLRDSNYRQPYVGVQFTNVTMGEDINVGCKAYAKNIEDDMRMQVGYFSFQMKVDK